jgi:uncharacterized protein with PhoU and TrkA domain
MTGEQLREKMFGNWTLAAEEVTRLEEEIQQLRKQVCDQDAALVESAYTVSDAFKTAFNLKRDNE